METSSACPGWAYAKVKTLSHTTLFRSLKVWEPYLKKHSGLPGPRANLELVAAVVEEGDADRLWRLSASRDRKSTRLNSSHLGISYAVFCLNKKTHQRTAATPPRDLTGA